MFCLVSTIDWCSQFKFDCEQIVCVSIKHILMHAGMELSCSLVEKGLITFIESVMI